MTKKGEKTTKLQKIANNIPKLITEKLQKERKKETTGYQQIEY